MADKKRANNKSEEVMTACAGAKPDCLENSLTK